MDSINIQKLLASSNYMIVNKELLKNIGAIEALLLAELCNEYVYYYETEQTDNDGYFYSTIENVEKNTGLSREQQDTALLHLIEKGIIDKNVKGIPPKRFFKINEKALEQSICGNDTNQFVEKTQNVMCEKHKSICGKDTTNINNITINKNINKKKEDISKDISKKEKKFVKPTIEEVESYIQEKQKNVNAIAFWNFYESKGWMIGKNHMKSWKSAIATWEQNAKRSNYRVQQNITIGKPDYQQAESQQKSVVLSEEQKAKMLELQRKMGGNNVK